VTHQLEEVERLCDRVILLKDGRAEAYGSIPEVQDQYGGTVIRLEYSGDIPLSEDYQVGQHDRHFAELVLTRPVDEAAVLRSLVESGVLVRGFSTSRLSLDDIFVKVYGERGDTVGA
jgi:ABC-2 type transport system ATP-binding protein